ncbi:hypothetical protein PC116_g19560 [Phytophthora cactorum]|nr:hypothetical protein PC112_g6240 [Phytophthora cactorum]KAG3012682.1 hypothetical protein PC120_g13701 [Phytophthora cactorum]KAG3155623.1 hypothetical protein PC128_g22056 [Phytophthora cactorum]KAG4232194.1 hypothetical protein PC116_g19560 [Phytophthora cactorum]
MNNDRFDKHPDAFLKFLLFFPLPDFDDSTYLRGDVKARTTNLVFELLCKRAAAPSFSCGDSDALQSQHVGEDCPVEYRPAQSRLG